MTNKSKKRLLKEIKIGVNKTEFITRVLTLISEDELTAINAILECCKEYDIDPADSAVLITGPIYEKIKIEAINRNMLYAKRKPITSSFINNCV